MPFSVVFFHQFSALFAAASAFDVRAKMPRVLEFDYLRRADDAMPYYSVASRLSLLYDYHCFVTEPDYRLLICSYDTSLFPFVCFSMLYR